MSFIRMPPRNKSGNSFAQPWGQEKKRRVRRKPQWDDTVQDLTVHKASPDELERRKESVRSKNIDVVKAEKFGKKVAKAKGQQKAPGSARKRRQNALLREILFDQSQLQDALNKSDQVMAVVKDLFGDDAQKKYRAVPNVTVAPALQNTRTRLPDGSLSTGPSKLDKLSVSQMDKSALNDLEDEAWVSSEASDQEEEEAPGYQPVMDLARFQRLLTEAEIERAEASRTAGQHLSHSMAERALEEVMNELEFKHRQKERTQTLETNPDGSFLDETVVAAAKMTAMNDTGKVKRTMARTNQGELEPPESQKPTELPNMDDLKKVLQGLEHTVADFERTTGRHQHVPPPSDKDSFSGVTQSLISAVTRLTTYLKESEHKLKVEATLRDQLSQDVAQFKALVDALTSDIISTQEEYARLQNEFVKYRRDSENQFKAIRQTLENAGMQVPVIRPQPVYPSSLQQQQQPVTNGNGYSHGHVQQTQARHPPAHAAHFTNGGHMPQIPQIPHLPHVQANNDADDAHSLVSLGTVEELALNMDKALRAHLLQSQEADDRMGGLPRPHIPGEGRTPPPSQGAALLLSPPRQADSPRVQGGRPIPSTGLDQARQQMRYDPPQSVQDIIREQQLLAARQQAAINQRPSTAPHGQVPAHNPQPSANEPHFHALANQRRAMAGSQATQPMMQNYMESSAHHQQSVSQSQPAPQRTHHDKGHLQQQLAELNRQHQEAQKKIDLLQQSHSAKVHGPVSPSISPIPQASDTNSEISSRLQPVRRPVPQQAAQDPRLRLLNRGPVSVVPGRAGQGLERAEQGFGRAERGAFAPVSGGPPREIRVSVPQMPPSQESPEQH